AGAGGLLEAGGGLARLVDEGDAVLEDAVAVRRVGAVAVEAALDEAGRDAGGGVARRAGEPGLTVGRGALALRYQLALAEGRAAAGAHAGVGVGAELVGEEHPVREGAQVLISVDADGLAAAARAGGLGVAHPGEAVLAGEEGALEARAQARLDEGAAVVGA